MLRVIKSNGLSEINISKNFFIESRSAEVRPAEVRPAECLTEKELSDFSVL
jgi:hypothetical protein